MTTATAEARWAWLREQTPVLRHYTYLNTGWSGPLSLPVVEAMRERLDLELEHGPTTRLVMEDRMALGARLRELTARLLGADDDEIAITGNTTHGLNIVINGIDLKPGDRVVTSAVEHSSGIVPAYYLRERRGAELAIVPVAAEDGAAAVAARFAEAIGARARLVVLSEISYSTGQLLPLHEIVQAAHRAGALVLVDGAQTAGHLPIDVRASGVDAYAIPAHKWLCGPDGLGMLYVRRDVIPAIEPVDVAGRAAASYDLAGHFEPEREKITKYELTTVSGALIAGTVAALEQHLASGPQAVWARARALCRYAERRFARIEGVTVTSPRADETRTGLFCFSVDSDEASRVSAFLQQEGRVVCRAVREFNAVRLSLHAFNTEGDVDRAAELVERALAEGIPAEVTGAVLSEARAERRT